MNDQTPMTGTALALPAPVELAVMFKTEGGLDPVLTKLEREALAMVKDLDPANRKDRDLMKSAANKVSLSKAEIDRHGKALTEAQRKEVAAVNAGRKVAETFLAALRDRVRKPADDWEAADEARKDRIKLRLGAFRPASVPASSEGLRALIAEIEAVTIDASWQEFQTEAGEAKAMCLNRLDEHLATAVEREEAKAEAERQAAELEQLRREKAEREEADRLRAEKEAADEAERQAAAKREQERAEAEAKAAREKEEAEALAAKQRLDLANRLIAHIEAAGKGMIDGQTYPIAMLIHEVQDRVLRDMGACGEHSSKVEAVRQRVLADLLEAQEASRKRHEQEEREKQEADAKAREEAAAQRERDRIAAEQKAAADAKAKREADKAHRARIRDDIATSLNAFCDEGAAVMIADAVMAGQIAHVEARL